MKYPEANIFSAERVLHHTVAQPNLRREMEMMTRILRKTNLEDEYEPKRNIDMGGCLSFQRCLSARNSE